MYLTVKMIRSITILSVLCLSASMGQLYGEPISLTAAQAVKRAKENNRTLKALDHQLKAADFGVKSAFTSFLPQASFNGTMTRKSGNDMMTKMTQSDLLNSYNIMIGIQQPIFTGFATLNGLRTAKTARSLQETTNRKTEKLIEYSVLQVYWGLATLEKSSSVAAQAVRQLEEMISNQEAMLDQGMTTEHDYLLSKASLAQAKTSELNVGKNIVSMKRQFAVLLGLPVNSEIVLTDTSTVQPVVLETDIDSLVKYMAERRADVVENRLQLQMSDLSVKMARAAYFPTLVAGFNYQSDRPSFGVSGMGFAQRDEFQDDWNVFMRLNFTIFAWGDRYFKVKKAKEAYEALSEIFKQKKASVENEALTAYETYEYEKSVLESAVLLADAREKAYEASQAKYEQGVISMYELLNTHSDFINARFHLLQATTDLELARINMELGGLGTSGSPGQ
jgi:outer membrane protein